MCIRMNKRKVSVVGVRRKKKKMLRVGVCEYNESVVVVYGDGKKKCECGYEEEREEERGEFSGL